MRLWLVRHAAPRLEPGRCYGRLDVEADEAATQAAAAALRAALPPRWAGWHSTRSRCRQLATALGEPPAGAWREDARLDELDFGAWEGRAWEAIGAAALDAWVADFAHHRPGGGESVAGMLARVRAALGEAAAAGADDLVWITHAGVIRAVQWLRAHGERLPRADVWPQRAPAWGQWVALELTSPSM
ncbi:alpha-ribazole phosphatase [Tepidimonas alkaliphilus]|uniref:Alpha-ribazole phosphatase n=1 Tax=Tepidimonas alkaliphilus TaxID=2588942 RepID=A0A554WDA5_9BURK|nr:histidine phosphatase family protein [Tepidimonas alkaliphilus]TSE21546.1 alpha-ribazole phosphatase [Tepidimonas alkaliphilus]